MAQIQLDNVTKRFGAITAVKDMSLTVEDGEFFTLLGPPGAGKTTTLRLIVGLEHPNEGDVYLDGVRVTDVYPGKRDIAMIFQNLALYPDKTVFDNIAYPLRERKVPKDDIERMVTEVATTLHIDPLLKRKPGQLSGGERQRVAIGRAIVRRPRAYLMDEPLSALDALLRLEMRVELKRLQHELGQTLVYVTHDQVEAMSMSDRMGVLRKGVLQQVDTPENIYNYPVNRFVATVVGSPPMNFIPGHIDNQQFKHPAFSATLLDAPDFNSRDDVALSIRPENIAVYTEQANGASIPAEVFVTEPLGAEVVVDLHVGETMVKAVVPSPFEGEPGQSVWLHFDPESTHVLDTATDELVAFGKKGAPVVQI